MVLLSNFDYFFSGNCRIIKIKYELEFHVIPSGMSSALVVKLPITIGTIPLQEYIGTLAPPVYKPGFAPTVPPTVLDQFIQPTCHLIER